jgi:alanyl-tRNA synthetase
MDDMVDVGKKYAEFCQQKGITFQVDKSVSSYDETTLFCPAGMQQFKPQFKDTSITNVTQANIQACLRMSDLDSVGDGTHFLCFDMMGLFSFRGLSVKQAIDFWMEFLATLKLKPDYVTIHPDKSEWAAFYNEYNVEIRKDPECVWSDGELSGYCTEFYINQVEIGNIVNICGDCIDVGFGLERLENIVNGLQPDSDLNIISDAIQKLLDAKYIPGPKAQGYVLRRLIRALYKKGGTMNNVFFASEKFRQEEIQKKYLKFKERHGDKPKEWWYDTYGIDLDLVE